MQRIIYKIATLTFNARFHEQPVYLADLVVNHTHGLEHYVAAERISLWSPPPRVQDAIRRKGIPYRCSSDVERLANLHNVGLYCKQLPETTETYLFDIAYN